MLVSISCKYQIQGYAFHQQATVLQPVTYVVKFFTSFPAVADFLCPASSLLAELTAHHLGPPYCIFITLVCHLFTSLIGKPIFNFLLMSLSPTL